MSDRAQDYRQLAKHYGGMYDEELLRLAAEYGDLTEVAQQALREELQRRKIECPEPQQEPNPEPNANPSGEALSLEMGLTEDGNILIGNFQSPEEAAMAYWALEIAGIHSKVVTPPGGRSNLPRLQVAPEDAERAQDVLTEPVSEEVMEQYEAAKEVQDFAAPDCPRCGTPDPLLESADPVNVWFCESCGHQWKDAPPDSTE